MLCCLTYLSSSELSALRSTFGERKLDNVANEYGKV